MVERFQDESDGPSIFILSLKPGGTGLNLTRANHVFHFDRWWNPAVENQATDRAFRIGQSRNVQVHKFSCVGTLEERIDEMIEGKKEIAAGVVGTGEGWLTELSTAELKEIFALRKEWRRSMSRWDYDDYFPPSIPRAAKGGIKAQSKRGSFGKAGGLSGGLPSWRVFRLAPG